MFLMPQHISLRRSAIVPAGAVVGFEGTVASIPAGWALCDGTGGTPDLRDRFIRGVDDATINRGDTGGSQTGQLTGTSSAEGDHGNLGGLGGNSSGSGYRYGIEGSHAHAMTGDLDPWMPPAREMIYIKAAAAAFLPANAIVWRFDAGVPAGYSTFAALQDRFGIGVGADSRTQLGADLRDGVMAVSSIGDHLHPTTSYTSGGGSSGHPNLGTGAHAHTGFTDTGLVTLSKPPYTALTPLIATATVGGRTRLILAYDGLLAALPAGWANCDGAGGTPDLRTRFPIGAGGAFALGATGGSAAAQPVTGGALASTSATHDHNSGSPNFTTALSDHSSYAWTHGHASWSGNADPLPPWYGLYFIMMN